MMFGNILIKNMVIVALVLTTVFLSQQSYFRNNSKIFTFPFLKKGETYISNTYDTLKNEVSSKVGGEVAKQQDYLQQEFIDQKNNLEKNTTDSVKKVLAAKILQAIGVQPQDLLTHQQVSSFSCPK